MYVQCHDVTFETHGGITTHSDVAICHIPIILHVHEIMVSNNEASSWLKQASSPGYTILQIDSIARSVNIHGHMQCQLLYNVYCMQYNTDQMCGLVFGHSGFPLHS